MPRQNHIGLKAIDFALCLPLTLDAMFPLPRWLLCLLLVFTSECTAQQIAKAFPWDLAPRYLLHDRDSIYGEVSRQRVRGMAKRDVLAAARSPWQDPYVERLDRLTALNEKSLRQMLKLIFAYYLRARTHLSLQKDAPPTRPVQPLELGSVVELREVCGLHHC